MARFMSEVNVEFCKEQFTTFVIRKKQIITVFED